MKGKKLCNIQLVTILSVATLLKLGHWTAWQAWWAHLGEDTVQPLERPIEMQFNPAWSRCDCLPSAEQKKKYNFQELEFGQPELID